MGVHKAIESPEIMLEHFNNYKNLVKANPIIVNDYVGKDGDRVERTKERPLTMEGFENYCFEIDLCKDLSQYFANREDRYKDFVPICTYVRKMIRDDQISGGMAGIYNPSITQRLNGLVEKTQNENLNREVPLFPDVSE